jgi:glucan phosphoethanolaminetransferase (alkaline phosphatase superfamily)
MVSPGRGIGYDRLLFAAVIVAALATFALDLFLLERKHEIFRGGFLQAHQIAGASDVVLFLATLAAVETAFFFALAGIWGAALHRFAPRRALVAYHFLFLVGGASASIIAVRYQILGYFTDFMNFTVLKNLGGGSLRDALAYGLEEGRLFAVLFACALLVYALGHLIILRIGRPSLLSGTVRLYLRTAAVAGIALALMILFINQTEHFRYHLERVTAYDATTRLFDALTDYDRDGYGFFAWWPDSAPFDSAIHPNALDVPGDGIDSDGLMGDFIYQQTPRLLVSFPGERPHLIVIVVESARADVLDAVVGDKPVAPVMRELARVGAAAPLYYSHTGFTTSSIKAMFSGSLSGLPPYGVSLFTLLKNQGYQVAVVSGQNESFGGMAETLKMRDSSMHFFDATSAAVERVFASAAPGSLTLSDERVVAEFTKIATALDWTAPVFVYVNLQSAHFPYYYPGMPLLLDGVKPIARSEIAREVKEPLMHTYFNAIANSDAAVGKIRSWLDQRGLLEETLLVVAGDHGESLFDDGLLGHGHQLNDIQTRTLLVANRRLPGLSGLLGQTDLALELLRGMGGHIRTERADSIAPSRNGPSDVFQLIGTLEHPGIIGFVDAQRERVTFNVSTRQAYFDTLGRWVHLADIDAYPGEAAKLRELINHWETLRWEQHLAAPRNKLAVDLQDRKAANH